MQVGGVDCMAFLIKTLKVRVMKMRSMRLKGRVMRIKIQGDVVVKEDVCEDYKSDCDVLLEMGVLATLR